MNNNITLFTEEKAIIEGLTNGSMKRFGSIIRHQETNLIVCYILESPRTTEQVKELSWPSLVEKASSLNEFISSAAEKYISSENKEQQVAQMAFSALDLTQIATGASILNLGISIAGFAYMGYKLNKLQNSINSLRGEMNTGFNRLAGQLAHVRLLVEHSIQEQQRLSRAVSEIHTVILTKEIADLGAVLRERSLFPNDSERESLKSAAKARLFFKPQALQTSPQLDAELMLNTDIAIQGWAVATAMEAHILLETGKIREARELLAQEVSQFKEVAVRWADELIADKIPELATAYRFATPLFQDYISPERVERIAIISSVDSSLLPNQRRGKRNNAEIELGMSKYRQSNQFNQDWIYRQIAVAEYLDALSELSARLEGLEAFADYCEQIGVKSSREVLLQSQNKPGLYVLKPTLTPL